MNAEAIIALFASTFAIVQFFVLRKEALRVQQENSRLQKVIHDREHELGARSVNLGSLASLDMELGRVKDIIKFHSITDQELTLAGVSTEQLAYLVASFHLGSIYYSTVEKDVRKEYFHPDLDSYRYEMFSSSDTRKAWPLVSLFLNDSNYKRCCQGTLDLFKSGKIQPRSRPYATSA